MSETGKERVKGKEKETCKKRERDKVRKWREEKTGRGAG